MKPEPIPMREIHRIMARLYEKREGMSSSEIVKSMEESTRRFVKLLGLEKRQLKKSETK